MKSKKKKKKFGITKLLLIFSFVAIVAIGIYLLLTAKDSNTGLTLVEKQWIEKNKDTLIDFSVPNNLSILGKDGEGVLYDLVDNIKEDTSLSFGIASIVFLISTIVFGILFANSQKNKNNAK